MILSEDGLLTYARYGKSMQGISEVAHEKILRAYKKLVYSFVNTLIIQ